MGDASNLQIRLFGQADVRASGKSLKLARRCLTLTMLGLLILRREQPVARTFLAYTLFPDHNEERALGELRRYLHLAGKALEAETDEPALLVDADTVRWNEDCAAFVDVVAFEQRVVEPSTCEEAVALYTGDLLEGVYDDWVITERERLRSLFLNALIVLIERSRTARDYGSALTYGTRLLTADPWREDVVRQVMAIRYASGDAAGAVAECDRFAKQLRAELGVSLMPETVTLRETIANDRPLFGEVEPPAVTRKTYARMLPFIGRERERELLQKRWDRAARGFGNCAFISGEAGVGKTRLVSELARVVENEGGRVVFGGTSTPESAPYQCIGEALRSARAMVASSATARTINVLARAFSRSTNACRHRRRLRCSSSGSRSAAPL